MAKSGITGPIERSQQSVSRYESAEKTPLKSNKFSSNDYYGICRINLRSNYRIQGHSFPYHWITKAVTVICLIQQKILTLYSVVTPIIHVERRRILKETVSRPISSCEMFMQTIPFPGRDKQNLPQKVQWQISPPSPRYYQSNKPIMLARLLSRRFAALSREENQEKPRIGIVLGLSFQRSWKRITLPIFTHIRTLSHISGLT